jgi:hypothetical protein
MLKQHDSWKNELSNQFFFHPGTSSTHTKYFTTLWRRLDLVLTRYCVTANLRFHLDEFWRINQKRRRKVKAGRLKLVKENKSWGISERAIKSYPSIQYSSIIPEEEPFEKAVALNVSEEEQLRGGVGARVGEHGQLPLDLLHLLRRHAAPSARRSGWLSLLVPWWWTRMGIPVGAAQQRREWENAR